MQVLIAIITLLHDYIPYHLLPDTQTLEQSVQGYTAEQVGQFLEGIGLGHHVATFIEENISGDMLLEATEETLGELGVTNATERLKIRVCVRKWWVKEEQCLKYAIKTTWIYPPCLDN